VLWAYAAVPDPNEWDDGSFPTIAGRIAPWFGSWMAVAASLAALSGSVGNLASYSRQLQAAADTGALPLRVLTQDWWRWRAPVPAMAALCILSLPLSFLDIDSVILLDTGCNSISVLLLACAFLRLRWTQPDLDRPFQVPWGTAGAVSCTACITLFVIFSLYSSSVGAPVYTLPVTIGIAVVLIIIGDVKQRFWPKTEPVAAAAAAIGLKLPQSPVPVLPRRGPSVNGSDAGENEALPLLISERRAQPLAATEPPGKAAKVKAAPLPPRR
jgi:amino acid transporter